MQQLIYFIQKYKYFLYVLLLLLISFSLTINNHSFHKSKFISSANGFVGNIYNKQNNISSYLDLNVKNQELIEENLRLRNELSKLSFNLDSISLSTSVDSIEYKQKFNYINGKVLKNEYTKPYNFLTINRGNKHGVATEMAVINSKGIIGITDATSNSYARVRSILNRNSKINARFKNSFYFGTLSWDAKDYNIVQLNDIPRQASVNIGDTIITGGKSAIFPEGIPIGVVLNSSDKTVDNTINIKLFNDMSNVGAIYIIKNFHKQEIKNLE